MRAEPAVDSQTSARLIGAAQPQGQYVAAVESLMYDKSTAREHLKDLVDTAAVGSGIHVESVEPGVIDTFLDLMQLRVVVAQIGGQCLIASLGGGFGPS